MVELPEAVRAKLLHVFEDIDKDDSGTISREELIGACHKLSVSISADGINKFLSSDASGDGALDFNEFCVFYAEQLDTVFSSLDRDGSGEISVDELRTAFKQLGYQVTRREVKAMLSKVDTNNDGVVSFDEFCCYFSSLPSPDMRLIVEQWASGLSLDVGTDLAPPPLPPPSVSVWRALFAGGMAGVVSRTATAPLEKIKLLAQTTNASRQIRIIPSIREIIVNEKWVGLFRGNGTNCLRVFPFSALVCLAYSNLAKYFPLDGGSVLSSGAGRLMVGAFAGSFATVLTHPMDVVRARLTVQSTLTATQYRGFTDGFMSILQNQGVRGLYRGLTPTLAAVAPFMAIQQSTYDLLKHWSSSYGMETTPMLFLTCGSIAGLTAQTVVYPLDVIRRQMQVHDLHQNPLAVAKALILKGRLFPGLTATYLKVMPAAAISVLARDALLGRLKQSQ